MAPIAEAVRPPVEDQDTAEVPSTTELDRYRTLLSDPDEGIRIAAARVLVERGDGAGRAVLLQALQDPDSHHRIDAVLALQQTTDPEVMAAIQRAARVERHPVARLVFKKVLKRLSE